MRYGGHQTFAIRDGWLYKGLAFLKDTQRRAYLSDDNAFDQLGVGKNMAKSINHWLLATQLAKKKTTPGKNGKQVETKELEPTEFADILKKHDENFLDENTWWFIHINLVNNPKYALTWHWFFNNFHINRFNKQICLQSLIRRESLNPGNMPSETTLERDLSCFLNSYSRDIPSRKKDPEDEIECPLTELGLMKYFSSSGYYQLDRSKKRIPFYVFYYALIKALINGEGVELGTDPCDLSFYDLLNLENGPGRVFALSNEHLFELLLDYEKESRDIQLHGLAGERVLRFALKSPTEIIGHYYESEVV